MVTQRAHRFSLRDYHRMAQSGVFPPDARVELLDGRILDVPPIGPLHGSVVNRLTKILNLEARGRWFVSCQNSLALDQFSEPQADLMLLRPAPDDYATGHPRPTDVYLLIEVADSTLQFDRKEKLPLYARAGIPEVWIVNLLEEQIEVHREPAFGRYATNSIIPRDAVASPAAFPEMQIRVAALLKK